MQASMYRAYHVIRARGIPSDHIIVMHYDNMAYNPMNPTPGVVINEVNGTDVYHNVPKDYTGNDVDPQIFISMLKGGCFEKPWLDYLESKNDPDETLQQQYEYIYKTSSVVREKIRLVQNISVPLPMYPVQFGDLRVAKLKVSQFFNN
ncbi:unnamed protein product [Oppiella nova]|uniref:Uncharacterized protein n=1 Tax=Oppiella nova TaxID=334625 RepID=A0A7R9M8R5_9ACAR|nr:unnamed protein product [Oppiella nova]CAG2172874.1 unnamed protein product [Oppiella nova]